MALEELLTPTETLLAHLVKLPQAVRLALWLMCLNLMIRHVSDKAAVVVPVVRLNMMLITVNPDKMQGIQIRPMVVDMVDLLVVMTVRMGRMVATDGMEVQEVTVEDRQLGIALLVVAAVVAVDMAAAEAAAVNALHTGQSLPAALALLAL